VGAIFRRLITNLSKGELTPKIECRPDLAAFFEGGRVLENWDIIRQGGVKSRPGTRKIATVKHADRDTILIGFEPDVDNARMIEVGDGYMRFYKPDKTRIEEAGNPIELATPYTQALLRDIHYTQSVDVMYMVQPTLQQQKLVRIADDDWSIIPLDFDPPPSFEKDEDISGGTATLTPAAITGTNILFTASNAVFYEADVGRIIIHGNARARITSFGASAGDNASPNDHVRCTIIDDFISVAPIPAGSWLLKLSPLTGLDVDNKEPVGRNVNLTAAAPAFRANVVGKFIHIYGGVIEITTRTNSQSLIGRIVVVLEGSEDADPVQAPGGAWTLEDSSWSAVHGFPRTIEFLQGRLGQAATLAQLTDFWLSSSDNFENYGVGIKANNAIATTVAHRQLSRIEWMADNVELFMGSAGAEMNVRSGKTDAPLGGDTVPLIDHIGTEGSAHIQPVVAGKRIIFVDRSRKRIFVIGYNINEDGQDVAELTGIADHITGETGIKLGPVGFAKRPDPRIFYIREDGEIATLTFNPKENVIGFTRYKTDGFYKSVGVIPQAAPKNDQVWVIVERSTGTFIEVFDEDASELSAREWKSVELDCATVYSFSTPTSILTNLGHLEGKTVGIVTDGAFRGTKVVVDGQVTLDEPATSHAEAGLMFESTLQTMRPAIEGVMTEGLPRQWKDLWLRLYKSMGGTINGEPIQYPPPKLGQLKLYTGDVKVTPPGVIDTDGFVTVKRDKPFPMTVLGIFGEVQFGDHS
jgi:hypothetical protein